MVQGGDTSGPSGGSSSGRWAAVGRWAGPGAIAAALIGMLAWSWRKWPDVMEDFGRELYVAWQLTTGKVLYADLAYFNGPLSPYVNATVFRVLGVGLRSLVVFNILLLAVLLLLVYRILSQIAGRFAATVACLVFVVLFGVGQLSLGGNFNFVCPYSHEATHGVLLAVLGIFCLWQYHRRGRSIFVVAAGLAVGLLFLTKVEITLAGGLAMTVGLALTIWVQRPGRRGAMGLMAGFFGSAVIPPAIAFGLLWTAMPAGSALYGTLGSWPVSLNTEAANLRYFLTGTGLIEPGLNVKKMLLWAGGYVAVFLPAALAGLAVRDRRANRFVSPAVAFLVVAGVLWVYRTAIPWLGVARPWPLLMLAVGAVCFVVLVKERPDRQASGRHVLRLTMVVFALVLLLKMVLYARIFHYGFALAMPAMLVWVAVVINWIPTWIDGRGGCGQVFRAAGLAALLMLVAVYARAITTSYGRRIHPVGTGADTFLADSRAEVVNEMLDVIEKSVGKDQTLAVLPEGVMLNYLARRRNPTPYINFNPFELIVFGEDRMLASFQAHPPDFIALARRPMQEFGYRWFGEDYGQRLARWIRMNYRRVTVVESPQLKGVRYGRIELMRRAADI